MIVHNKEACLIPGESSQISEVEHFERYRFACNYVKNRRVLDIACGVGYGSQMLANANASSVVAGDIMKENIDYANENYAEDNITFLCKDIKEPIDEGLFDIVTYFETIEHIDDCFSVLGNIKK